MEALFKSKRNPLAVSLPETSCLRNIYPLTGYGILCVYFLRRDSDGAIKIGRTGVLHRRLVTIARKIGEPVIPLAAVRGGSYLENSLHRHFKSFRLDGEWFRPTEQLVDFIAWLNRETEHG